MNTIVARMTPSPVSRTLSGLWTTSSPLTRRSHVSGTVAILQVARKARITFNPKKFQFTQQQIAWASYRIKQGGYEADPNKLRALTDFSRPTNRMELWSFMDLVERLAGFCKDMAATNAPPEAIAQ